MIGLLSSLRAPVLTGVFVWIALMLAGCATPQMASLDGRWPQNLATRAELDDVPFYPQEDYECGPAALAMVAGAAGVPVRPEALVDQVYLPGRKGSLQLEMLAASRRQGLLAYPLRPHLEAVMHEVAAGNPVLVFQNLALPIYPVWHYAVVIGFDRDRKVVMLHSGRSERMEMSLFTFERTWARAGYWSMVALPPARLPATAESQAYAIAASALERVNPGAAQVAYASALQRWPDDRAALLGAGNTAYALAQREIAIEAYRTAVRRQPDFSDAWNNLAQVLLDAGQVDEAAAAIDRAVTLGGERLARYLELQATIKSQQQRKLPGALR